MHRTLLLLVALVAAVYARSHLGQCYFCGTCFVSYTDRDAGVAQKPYKVMNNSFDINEDSCLANCLLDEVSECAVVLIVFICVTRCSKPQTQRARFAAMQIGSLRSCGRPRGDRVRVLRQGRRHAPGHLRALSQYAHKADRV